MLQHVFPSSSHRLWRAMAWLGYIPTKTFLRLTTAPSLKNSNYVKIILLLYFLTWSTSTFAPRQHDDVFCSDSFTRETNSSSGVSRSSFIKFLDWLRINIRMLLSWDQWRTHYFLCVIVNWNWPLLLPGSFVRILRGSPTGPRS